MLDKGDLITLDDNKEYIIANITTLNGIDFIYLVTKDGLSDFKICYLDERKNELVEVNDLKLLEKLLTIFSKR